LFIPKFVREVLSAVRRYWEVERRILRQEWKAIRTPSRFRSERERRKLLSRMSCNLPAMCTYCGEYIRPERLHICAGGKLISGPHARKEA